MAVGYNNKQLINIPRDIVGICSPSPGVHGLHRHSSASVRCLCDQAKFSLTFNIINANQRTRDNESECLPFHWSKRPHSSAHAHKPFWRLNPFLGANLAREFVHAPYINPSLVNAGQPHSHYWRPMGQIYVLRFTSYNCVTNHLTVLTWWHTHQPPKYNNCRQASINQINGLLVTIVTSWTHQVLWADHPMLNPWPVFSKRPPQPSVFEFSWRRKLGHWGYKHPPVVVAWLPRSWFLQGTTNFPVLSIICASA